MSNQLAVRNIDYDGLSKASLALYKSGYFVDVKSEAQAMVKVMAGAELGIPPFASMTGINIIQGKPVLGGNIIATLIKNSGRYDYRIKSHDNNGCTIQFFEHGNAVGESTFDIKDADAAGLLNKDNWKKYRKAMLFNRAISQGARWYAPGIFGGAPVYTADEMGADTDEEGYVVEQSVITRTTPMRPEAEIIEELGFDTKPEPEPRKQLPNMSRPLNTDDLRHVLEIKASNYAGNGKTATQKQRSFLVMLLDQMLGGDSKRHEFLFGLLDVTSSKQIDDQMVLALLDWIKPVADSGGEYKPDAMAAREAQAVLSAAQVKAGQQPMI